MALTAPNFARWRYTATGHRDLRLDLLRGFAIFAMAVDHVGGNSPFHLLSGGNRFFVSAAEAFVFISGVTVGIVYCRSSETMRSVMSRAWKRSWTLYMVSVCLALAFASAAALAGIPKGAPFSAEPARFVFDVVALRRSYYLVEVMLLYAFLMALVPVIILAIRKGVWWALLGGSFALWLAFQLWPGSLVLPWTIVDYQDFPFAAWQLVFVSGVLVGHFRDYIGAMLARGPRPPLPGGWLGPTALAMALLVWFHTTDASALDAWRGDRSGARLLDAWFDKTSLPLPRLLACALVFAFAWQLATVFWQPIRRGAGSFLVPLGSSALYAFGAHVLTACALEIAIIHLHGTGELSAGESFLAQAAMLTTVWCCTRHRVLLPQLRWLGNPPIAVAGNAWRPAPSLAVVGVLLLVTGLAGSPSNGTVSSLSFGTGSPDDRRAAYNNPVTTVTPPRASLKQLVEVQGGEDDGESPLLPLALAPEFEVSAGTLDEDHFPSLVLGREMPYAIYLPPSYDRERERSYPVVYLLHGAGAGYTEWALYGLPQKAAEMMASGRLTEFIIVMPEGGRGYWANGLSGGGENWADYLTFEVVPRIDATYRTIPERSGRAIGGLSRGGFGALNLAFSHPEMFSIVAANSPSLPGTTAGIEDVLVSPDDFPGFDPVELARQLDPATAPRTWIDVGDSDDWQPAVRLLDTVLAASGINHQISIGEGGHLEEYWMARTADYLEFYSAEFTAEESPAG